MVYVIDPIRRIPVRPLERSGSDILDGTCVWNECESQKCSKMFVDSTENGLPVRDAVQKQIARNKVKRAKLESNDVVGQAMHDLCLAGHELQRLGREGTIHGIAAVLARELEPRRQIPAGDRRI